MSVRLLVMSVRNGTPSLHPSGDMDAVMSESLMHGLWAMAFVMALLAFYTHGR